ncbi:MAG: tRNA-dihydrouridine synthase [Candidatus Kerfeldbacteria bacterium]|nr:tRNA-dihydrouridine synthase [Candidatus Kerfeldbacteria bacterium]
MINFWLQLNKPILVLAPMEGVTDLAFRLIAKQGGADVVYTEFISSDAIGHLGKSALAKMARRDDERPVICQIFGRDPVMFAQAARMVEEAGFDGLDINFGCPARKVVGSGSGVALLRQPEYARQLIEAALHEISIPLSIKVRASIRKEARHIDPDCTDRATALDLAEVIKDLPVAAMMIHGRSYEQGFNGAIDLDMIRQVRRVFPGLVLANGGINSPERAAEVLEQTGADGLGIARGAMGRPWIFHQTREYLATKKYATPQPIEIAAVIRKHASLVHDLKGPRGLLEFRKHIAQYLTGWRGAAELRARAVRIVTLDDVEHVVQSMLEYLRVTPETKHPR